MGLGLGLGLGLVGCGLGLGLGLVGCGLGLGLGLVGCGLGLGLGLVGLWPRNIPAVWIMKTLKAVFAPILALLINISISQATLPSSYKRAIIRPRLKKPGLDPSDPANYRPVSNLSFVSKLIERVIHRQLTQLSTYVETNQLLPPTQSGFRRFHSTETAVVKVYNDIVTALDAGLITALLLLDFSAAFDCVDPSILLQVLELKFGITASALKWIASFLTDRTHSVRVGTRTSKVCNILFGVPQGSILGPPPIYSIHFKYHRYRLAAWYSHPHLCR